MSEEEVRGLVKPLEWTGKDYIRGREHAYPHDTGMPCYTVSTKIKGRWWRGIDANGGLLYISDGGLEEAKAACQADYASRILSALNLPPTSKQGT